MDVKFSAAYDELRAYLAEKVPAFRNIVTHWVEPGSATDGLAMVMPHSNYAEEGKITLNVKVSFYTVRNNANDIAPAQVAVMERLFNVIYGGGGLPMPVRKAVITETHYEYEMFRSSHIGRADALVQMIMEFDDDDHGG